jgi:hypothetical protein
MDWKIQINIDKHILTYGFSLIDQSQKKSVRVFRMFYEFHKFRSK